MVNVWNGGWQKVAASKSELDEALRLMSGEAFVGYLDAMRDGLGHDESMRSAMWLDAVMSEKLNEEDEVSSDELEAMRKAWSESDEAMSVSDEEVERRRVGMSSWNVGIRVL